MSNGKGGLFHITSRDNAGAGILAEFSTVISDGLRVSGNGGLRHRRYWKILNSMEYGR